MKVEYVSPADGIRATARHTVALGVFDGVHLGHEALLRRTSARAEDTATVPAVFTFSDAAFKGGAPLSTLEGRLARFEMLGIRQVFVAPFEEVRHLTPEQFVSQMLVHRLGAVGAVCGFNYRFGKDAAGDGALLCRLLPQSECLSPVSLDGAPVSSSRIRHALAAGDVVSASNMLGRPYAVSGCVTHGKGLGRTVGIPTANLSPAEMLPRAGVYITETEVDGCLYPSLTDVGTRPTVEEAGDVRAETHIPHFSGDLYGRRVTVRFLRRLRGEMKFDTQEALLAQIARDIASLDTESAVDAK